jgi:uncharacterized zinc-type alcohol dehydrogenase-like protein
MEVKGLAAMSAVSKLAPFKFERRAPKANDVVIEIKYCGICHSDIHQARDEWGGSKFPMVPGHEITGIVTAIGAATKNLKVGDRVGVGCFVDSCRECSSCRAGLEQYCEQGMTGTYNSIERDGTGVTQGGYSTKIVVHEDYVLKIPDNLALDEAAPLLCAGITLYSPLVHWKAGPGKKVAIVGMGGLGHMGVKLASAMGAHVTVLSHSPKKMDDAKKFGARSFFSISDQATSRMLRGQFDLIINTVSVGIDWNQLMNMLRLDGVLVVVGIPENQVPVGAFSLIGGRRSLAGSLIGGIRETQQMLDFCSEHRIACEIEKITASEVNIAFDRVVKSDVRYRFVIDTSTI